MTGHDRERLPERSETTCPAASVLEITDLVVPAAHGARAGGRRAVTSVHSGEILGIAGVEGNGQRELVDALDGSRHTATPEPCMIDGVDVTNADPHDRRTAGMGVIPEDRHRLGLILDMSLAENLAVADLASGGYRRRGCHRLEGRA